MNCANKNSSFAETANQLVSTSTKKKTSVTACSLRWRLNSTFKPITSLSKAYITLSMRHLT